MSKINKTMILISSLCFVLLCLFLPFMIIFQTARNQDTVYDETYYAELPLLYDRLSATEGRKIVIIGNSAVAFGIDSLFLEELLSESGYDYSVCKFGLYGSIGTKAMLELSKASIGEGDIVIFMPEMNSQAQSLYFSANELWYAVECNPDMISLLDSDMRKQMYASLPYFVSTRNSQHTKAKPSGIYARSSFDERGDLKNYDRPFNVMEDGTGLDSMVDAASLVPSEEYYDYINAFFQTIKKQGADMYFLYCPVNKESLSGSTDSYCKLQKSMLQFDIIGSIEESILESEWFYDSNFHLNESGMELFTLKLFDMLKTHWGDSSVTQYSIPSAPARDGEATEVISVSGDNSDENCFVYEEVKNGYRIIGLTSEGKERYQLTVPVMHEGKAVTGIDNNTFKNDKILKKVVIQANIKTLPNSLFYDCKALTEIVLCHTEPQEVSVGYHLLDGTTARIKVPMDSLSAFKNNYFWGSYAEVTDGY